MLHRDRPLSQGHQHHGTARDPVKRPPMPTKRAVSCMSSTRCKRSRRAACWDLAPALASLLADSLHSYGHAAPGRHLVHGGLRRRTVDSGQRLGAGTLQDEKKFGRNRSAQKVFSAGLLRVRPETTRRGNVQISTIENTGLKSLQGTPTAFYVPPLFFPGEPALGSSRRARGAG